LHPPEADFTHPTGTPKMYEFMNKRLRLIRDSLKDKYVCASCFRDYAICEFINSHLKWPTCTYCGRTSSQLISASFSDVLHFIMEGVTFEWIASTPEVEWEAEHYGWHGGRDGWLGSDSMIQSVLPELRTAKGELLKDIVAYIAREWRPRRQYDPEPEDFFSYRWDEFANAVKYQTRYVYYRVNTDWQKDINNRNRSSRFRIRPSHVIEEVLDNISDLDITQTISPGTIIWRARMHDATVFLSTPEELGPPSFEEALASTRMSPAGIPVFYGSFERETTIAETLKPEGGRKPSRVITVGRWETLQEFRALNLAEIPATPSLFDAKLRKLRPTVSFLESFSEEISQPILKDGREHIEYVPTQIFTEYIKHVYKDREGNKVDGILYRSAIRENGINCVLFITKKDCVNYVESMEPGKTESKQKMLLETFERIPKVEADLFLPKQDTRRYY